MSNLEERAVKQEAINSDIYPNSGVRPDLGKRITITEEIEKNYKKAKNNIIGNRKYYVIFSILFFVSLVFLRTDSDSLAPKLIGLIILALDIITLIIYNRKAKAKGIEDIYEEYNKNCVTPLITQIDEKAIVTSTIDTFPIVGSVQKESKIGNNKIFKFLNSFNKIPGNPANNLGEFLKQNRVCPKFNTGFNIDLSINTLDYNHEGFHLVNGCGYTTTNSQNGSNTTIIFYGSVIVVRMKHKVRCDVSLFTTGTTKLFKKETSNGYEKIKDSIDTENQEFNDNFDVTSQETSQAFFILSPLVMENLLKLKEKYGNFGLYIHDDYLIFGMNSENHPLSMPRKIKSAKNMTLEQSVEDMFDLLKNIYILKDAVDLNFKSSNNEVNKEDSIKVSEDNFEDFEKEPIKEEVLDTPNKVLDTPETPSIPKLNIKINK